MGENDRVPEVGSAAPQSPALPRAERRERAACDALRALLRDHYLHQFGANLPREQAVPVRLNLRVKPGEAWATEFDPPFAEQIQGQIEDAQAGWDRYQRGHVFCFRCQSAGCEHATPPGPLAVFRGYSSTGTPEWWELAQAFIEARDERVDRLYAEPPAVLARMQYGHDLKDRQLSSFGRASKTYAILGQVVAGYFTLPGAHRAGERRAARFAVTLQAVEARGADGAPVLRLNPIVGGTSPEEWDELLVSAWRPSVGRALDAAARAVEDVERQVRSARESSDPEMLRKHLQRMPGILNRLARTLEQGDRQTARRTRHAEQHAREERPVHKALEDARRAGEEQLFFDEKHHTWIACGRQGRAHAFNEMGRHVTSFVLPPGGAEFRVRTRRWRTLPPEEAAEFRALIAPAPAGKIPAGAADSDQAQRLTS